MNFILLERGQVDQIFELYSSQYTLYSGWLPYVALSGLDNFMIIGYETANGYGFQISMAHSGAVVKARAKLSGNWSEWKAL